MSIKLSPSYVGGEVRKIVDVVATAFKFVDTGFGVVVVQDVQAACTKE